MAKRVLDDLSVFCAVVKCGSLKQASKVLELPHSTVSRRIEKLEKDLGLTLLHRTTRAVKVSSRGQQLYDDCAPLLDSLRSSVNLAVDSEVQFKGSLKITLPVRAGVDFLGGWLIDFATEHPDLRLDLSLSNENLNLIKDDVDLAFRVGPLEDSSAIALHLWDIPYSVCATRSFIEKHGLNARGMTLEQLANLSTVVTQPATQWFFIDTENQAVDFAPTANLLVDDLGLALHAVSSNQFISFLPNEMLLDKDIVELTVEGLTPRTRSMYAYYLGKRHANSQIKHLVEYIRTRREDYLPAF